MEKLRFFLIGVIIALATFTATQAQQTDDTCPTIITSALEITQQSCDNLGRNQACYGHNRVDVTFWEEQDDLTFSQPADRTDLLTLQTIATSPLNIDPEAWGVVILSLQTTLSDNLPGQAITFLLMGDTIVENAVTPDTVANPVDPIKGQVNGNVILRSSPTTTSNVVAVISNSAEINLIGKNEAGDWFEVQWDAGSAWVYAQLVELRDDPSALPVTYGDHISPRYAPMQAFYFQSGIGDIHCKEAPSALIIQNTTGTATQLRINDLNVTIGSTLVVFTDEVDNEKVMVLSLIEGQAELEFDNVTLDTAGETIAITLNADNRVDADSKIVDFESEAFRDIIQTACDNANQTGLLNGEALAGCDVDVTAVDDNRQIVTDGSTIPDDGVCTVVAINASNLRGGPGTNYTRNGQLAAAEFAYPDGKATGADSYLWWRLDSGAWIRSDLVDASISCGGVTLVKNLPPIPTNTSTGIGNTVSSVILSSPACPSFPYRVKAGTVTLSMGQSKKEWTSCDLLMADLSNIGIASFSGNGPAPYNIRHGICESYGSFHQIHTMADVVLTPGTYTYTGEWGYTVSCTFTVSD